MARAFDDKEREQIRQRLLESGRRYFTAMGLRRSSVELLAGDAGIGKGSFYKFFPNKEALCMELFMLEEKKKEALLELDSSRRPETFFPEALKLIGENELVRALYRHNDWALLLRAIDNDYERMNREGDDAFSRELLLRWGLSDGRSGEDIHRLSVMLTAVLRELFFASLHKEEVGEGYDEAMELLCAGAASRFGAMNEEGAYNA